jgi:hypothetical protein
MSKRHPFPEHTSGLLFIMAKEAAKRARKMSHTFAGEEIEAMVSVVLCVIVAEAGINEIGEWFEFHRLQPQLNVQHGLPYGFEGMQLRMKWSLLPMIVRQKTFDRGSEPWQSFNALVELRNAIVHLGGRAVSSAATSFLKAKNLDKRHVVGFEVARWACETIVLMFSKLTELVDPPKTLIDLTWCWTPTHSFPPGLSTPGDPFQD